MDQTETVQLGHHDVRDHDLWTFLLNEFHPLSSIMSCDHPVALESQRGIQQFADIGIVLDDE